MFSFLVSYDIELNLGKDIGVFHEISKRFLLAGSFTFPTFLGPHFGGFFLLGFKNEHFADQFFRLLLLCRREFG